MCFGFDVGGCEDVGDASFGVNDEGGAERPHITSSIHFLFSPDAEGFDPFLVGVSHEVEVQFLLGDEAEVGGGRINADADDLAACPEEFGVVVTEVARLGGAARCAVFGIKIDDERFAAEVRDFQFAAIFVEPREFGSEFTFLQHEMEE